MRIFLSIFFLSLTQILLAQKPSTYNSSKDADPRAKAILKQLKDKLGIEKGTEITFEFKYIPAESAPTVEKGKVAIKGKKFQLQLNDQVVISDQQTVWTYIKKRNEVQLQSAGDIENDPLSPFKLLQIHDSPDYTYVLAGERKQGTIFLDIIEFKPLDTSADFFKIRAEIDRAKKQYKKLSLFLKNGDQYELSIVSQVTKSFTDNSFVFNASLYPGVKTEDLR